MMLLCKVCQQLTLLFAMFSIFSCHVWYFLMVCSVAKAHTQGLVMSLHTLVGNVIHNVPQCRNVSLAWHQRKPGWKGFLEVIQVSLENCQGDKFVISLSNLFQCLAMSGRRTASLRVSGISLVATSCWKSLPFISTICLTQDKDQVNLQSKLTKLIHENRIQLHFPPNCCKRL